MFDGENAFQITNEANQLTNWFDRKKVYFKMSRLKRKMINLVKDLHRKLACYLSKNYDILNPFVFQNYP